MARLLWFFLSIGATIFCCHCGYAKKVVHVSPDLAGKILAAVSKCQPETGLDANGLLMIYDGKYREDQQFKDFIFCCYKSTGFLRNDGQLNQEKSIKAFNNDPLVQEGIRRCGSQQNKDAKEDMFQFYKCFVDTTPVIITL